jgi:hypothetical protein
MLLIKASEYKIRASDAELSMSPKSVNRSCEIPLGKSRCSPSTIAEFLYLLAGEGPLQQSWRSPSRPQAEIGDKV